MVWNNGLISDLNPAKVSSARKTEVVNEDGEAEVDVEDIWIFEMVLSCCPPPVYIPQCLNSRSLVQTSPFTMVILQFQPLFQTLLLHMEPCCLPIGHPSHVTQDLRMRSLRGEY